MKLSRVGAAFWMALLAAGSAAAVPDRDRGAFGRVAWEQEVRSRGLDPSGVIYPFEISVEMANWVDSVLEPALPAATDRLGRLQRALFDGDGFEFAYDEDLTLPAEQAFAQRRGNCLSFTVMFVALSRSAGLETFLVAVSREPVVDRVADLVILNHHVVAGHRTGSALVTYDFAVSDQAPVWTSGVIDDVRASAMFHANLGGNALRHDRPEQALSHLEITTTLAPTWPAGWVNLGVAASRLGDLDRAFSAYRTALEVDPGNSSALNNMSVLYARLGRNAEATAALRAAAERTDSPFTLIALADTEIMRGRTDRAAAYLRRAKRGHSAVPEVWDALARLAEAEGEPDRAARQRARAERLRERAAAE
jgi:Flp pilus assembly protein TadD